VRRAPRADVHDLQDADRAWVEEVLVARWGAASIVTRGQLFDAARLPGFVAEVDGERVGLVTFRESDRQIEVVTLDALRPSVGVGTGLLAAVEELARGRHCHRVTLVTTNDNGAALRFYQRRGFRLVAVHVGAVDRARALKPGIPEVGLDGIALHDEIELARELTGEGNAAPASAGWPKDLGEVVLDKVAEKDRAELGRLLQLDRYDFSAIRPDEFGTDGTAVHRCVDRHFEEPDRAAWLIRHAGGLAGFVLARSRPDGASEVARSFVLRAHRRVGVGRRAAAMLFTRRPGRWEVAYDVANEEASRFWPSVVAAAAEGPVECGREGPPRRTHDEIVLRFSTR